MNTYNAAGLPAFDNSKCDGYVYKSTEGLFI